MTLEQKVNLALKHIQSEELNAKQLVSFYDNAVSYDGLSEEQLESIIDAITIQLRTRFPSIANKTIGPKDTEFREMLDAFWAQLEKTHDLSANVLKGGPKTGGHALTGKAYIDTYVSYKNQNMINTSLGIYQQTPDSSPYVQLLQRNLRPGNKLILLDHHEPIENFDAICAQYAEMLKEEL